MRIVYGAMFLHLVTLGSHSSIVKYLLECGVGYHCHQWVNFTIYLYKGFLLVFVLGWASFGSFVTLVFYIDC
jgi:hypothetical protein